MRFGWKIVRLLPALVREGKGKPQNVPQDLHGPTYFASLDLDDWEEAELTDVCHYLRGGTDLCCPLEWKQVFPTHL